jgi:ABC-type multidrug transport system fused ATPase/permease subunit
MVTAVRTLIPFFKPYRGRMLLVMVSVLVVSGAGLLAPWLIRLLVQVVRLAEGDLAAATQSLVTITLALLAVYLLRSAGQFINFHVSHVVAFGLVHDLQVAVYQRASPRRISPSGSPARSSHGWSRTRWRSNPSSLTRCTISSSVSCWRWAS